MSEWSAVQINVNLQCHVKFIMDTLNIYVSLVPLKVFKYLETSFVYMHGKRSGNLKTFEGPPCQTVLTFLTMLSVQSVGCSWNCCNVEFQFAGLMDVLKRKMSEHDANFELYKQLVIQYKIQQNHVEWYLCQIWVPFHVIELAYDHFWLLNVFSSRHWQRIYCQLTSWLKQYTAKNLKAWPDLRLFWFASAFYQLGETESMRI